MNPLKQKIDEVIMHITISNMLLWFINNSTCAVHFKKTFVKDIAGFRKKDGSGKTVSLHSAFDFCKQNPTFNIQYMKKVLMVEINRIFENLPKSYQQNYLVSYKGKGRKNKVEFSKEFEFFRHIRNACSHNNRFKFDDRSRLLFDNAKNPHYEASWRTFKIDKNSENNELFFSYLDGGDAIELLEFIRDTL